ncbi:hypothetical protein JCM19232_6261 [Vibrio ishigakensis]|uniref:Acetyltransferase n=1 Tax=Vibrio ishigakensis TaxID=1481914 RepID=A0A0B8P6T5_9VIBR|nr:hypothetical protein JCM19232_6261 [Vibrio ishigakensis]
MFVSDHLSDRKLFATVDEGHLASMRILEKLGFDRKEQREDEFWRFLSLHSVRLRLKVHDTHSLHDELA